MTEQTRLDTAREALVALQAQVDIATAQLAPGKLTPSEHAVLLERVQSLPGQIEVVELEYATAELTVWSTQALASDAAVAAIDAQIALVEQRATLLNEQMERLMCEEGAARAQHQPGRINQMLFWQVMPGTELRALRSQMEELREARRRAAGPGVMARLRCQIAYHTRLLPGDFVPGFGCQPSDKWDRSHSIAALAYAATEAQRAYGRLFVNHCEAQR